jgi:hypothetical protein
MGAGRKAGFELRGWAYLHTDVRYKGMKNRCEAWPTCLKALLQSIQTIYGFTAAMWSAFAGQDEALSLLVSSE